MIIEDKIEKNESLLLAEKLRPTKNSIHLLVGSAKKIWDRDLAQWRMNHKFHLILWGPPGSGKTTLARLLGENCNLPFIMLSGVRDGVKEIRTAIQNCSTPPILFIDEIHRLSRTQQDALLPILEYSEAWLIGATTESPTTELSAPFLSRVRCIYNGPLQEEDILHALEQGLNYLTINKPNIFQNKETNYIDYLKNVCFEKIAKMSGGDLRFSLNLLENICYCNSLEEETEVFANTLKSFTAKNHYDYISAMIKSMRGSDPDAALFYAITSLDKGEDPLFIARRCIIFASEDVSNADPQALTLALSAYKAIEAVGMPEGRIPLAQCVTYLASTFKSNRAYKAIETVRNWRQKAEENGMSIQPPVELTLKGKSKYKYPHDFENSFVSFNYLPDSIVELKRTEKKPAYLPTDNGVESRLKSRLSELWKKK
ncbi:AAA family ATPase [Pigmentibacter sp. JX0631]|uniref:AAA family ATPase n=1 Tax=Pigmentibacter sp. JX0631 TaxID=2976982 RepID=UPI0024686431|nr:AAA family ATPase [Pigmentibacter sp. JX0631]WGL60418.1 AAA family ATPase [Pigmentibacter sp. JX0631]